MSIGDEPLTKEEYVRRLFESKAEQRKKDAELPFEEKVDLPVTRGHRRESPATLGSE